MLGKPDLKKDDELAKKKIYSIYAKNTPTVRAQTAMGNTIDTIKGKVNRALIEPIKEQGRNLGNLADTSFGGAGTRQALNAVARGREGQKSYLKEQRIKSMDPIGQTQDESWLNKSGILDGAQESQARADQFQGLTEYDTRKQHGPILGPYAPTETKRQGTAHGKVVSNFVDTPISIVQPNARPLTAREKLQALDQGQQVRATNDGYAFEGSAGDASKFLENSISRNDPVAQRNREIQRQQWEARQPKQRVLASGPTLIAAPKTMGDMLRYNRESKAQKQNADIANAQAKTGIDAFAAKQLAEHKMRSDANAARTTDIYGEHYNRVDAIDALQADTSRRHYANSDNLSAQTLAETIRSNKAEQALKATLTPSEIALREAQARNTSEQALTAEQERDALVPQNDLNQAIITQRHKIANDPNKSPEESLNALVGQPQAPTTEYQKSVLAQKRFDNFTAFMSAFPPNRQEEAEQKYMEYEKKFGGDPTKMQALIANNPEVDEDEETYKQRLFQ